MISSAVSSSSPFCFDRVIRFLSQCFFSFHSGLDKAVTFADVLGPHREIYERGSADSQSDGLIGQQRRSLAQKLAGLVLW